MPMEPTLTPDMLAMLDTPMPMVPMLGMLDTPMLPMLLPSPLPPPRSAPPPL